MMPIGMVLGRDGSLVATFQSNDTFPFAIAIAKFDSTGRIVWKRFDQSHHWPALDDEGRIYTPYATFPKGVEYVGHTAVRLECATGQPHMDGIHVSTRTAKCCAICPLCSLSCARATLAGFMACAMAAILCI